jgi:hypothetical protein
MDAADPDPGKVVADRAMSSGSLVTMSATAFAAINSITRGRGLAASDPNL